MHYQYVKFQQCQQLFLYSNEILDLPIAFFKFPHIHCNWQVNHIVGVEELVTFYFAGYLEIWRAMLIDCFLLYWKYLSSYSKIKRIHTTSYYKPLLFVHCRIIPFDSKI